MANSITPQIRCSDVVMENSILKKLSKTGAIRNKRWLLIAAIAICWKLQQKQQLMWIEEMQEILKAKAAVSTAPFKKSAVEWEVLKGPVFSRHFTHVLLKKFFKYLICNKKTTKNLAVFGLQSLYNIKHKDNSFFKNLKRNIPTNRFPNRFQRSLHTKKKKKKLYGPFFFMDGVQLPQG